MFQQNVFEGPGTGTFTSHSFEIILLLLGAALIGLWFGWILWSKYRQSAERLRLENESLNATTATLRTETDSLRAKLTEIETERSSLVAQVQNLNWESENNRGRLAILESDLEKVLERNRQLETELGLALDPDADTQTIPFEVTAPIPTDAHDDLPDLEESIANAIDDTFDRANLDMPELEDAIADAVTAAIATHQDAQPADEQEETQALDLPNLEPQPETELRVISPSAEPGFVELSDPLVAAVHTGPRDDLKIVEGVGPKIEELLFKAGITTYGQLAATSVQQLKELLQDAGSRFAMHDPGTWSAQALLAANGEWDNLKAYQDFLNAGKRPDK
ncbi:MAG: hypothetical protein IT260_07700 [Saprospiraceae bacterium]|nr:hypothetical protein [Saprospiraceae bacterium]